MVARLGTIDVGAVFPDRNNPTQTTWAFWLGMPAGAAAQTKAKSVDAAKNALLKRFCEATGLEAAE
ncbi:MAG: hypothetical protein EPN45_16200 [Rhizobiaceae bacterium]|nr:MAG: hypothetical protein EPN45_16200 [Rhizobiaceae bacterium]